MAVTLNNLKDLCTKFSVRNFITDLPRMLNDAFMVIYNVITKFYDIDNDKIRATKGDIDYLTASTLVTNNLTFNSSTGEKFNYSELVSEISSLKEKIDNITYITKQQIDTLNASIYPTQSITVGEQANIQSRITSNRYCESYDSSIVSCSPAGLLLGVSEGFTYISVSNSTDSEVVYVRVLPVVS